MQKTRIDWADYTINPVRGLCPMDCKDNKGKSYCYARRLYKRFKWNPEIRMEPDWMEELPKKPSRIFVGSTMELFGDWVEEWMWDSIWQYVNTYPQHTFIFLTKCPQNLPKEFPDNCWVGVSATNWLKFSDALGYMSEVKAKVKFLSFEPLHERISFDLMQKLLFPMVINWVIIGQQTPVNQETKPEVEWIENIVNTVDECKTPVFLKNNLDSLLPKYWDDGINFRNSDGTLRQEFPKVVSQ